VKNRFVSSEIWELEASGVCQKVGLGLTGKEQKLKRRKVKESRNK
jgi:hypothetical protein